MKRHNSYLKNHVEKRDEEMDTYNTRINIKTREIDDGCLAARATLWFAEGSERCCRVPVV